MAVTVLGEVSPGDDGRRAGEGDTEPQGSWSPPDSRRAAPGRLTSSLRAVDGKAVLDPVLLAALIDHDVVISELLETRRHHL